MPHSVVFRLDAVDDLDSLYAFIAQDNPDTAIGLVRRVRARCIDLGLFPRVGRARDDLRPGLRLIAFERRIVIAYLLSDEQVDVLRVFYGGRNIEALLGGGGM